MKRIITIGILLLSSFYLSAGEKPVYGTFIQPWLFGSWSDETWEKEANYMKSIGIEAIIMGDVAYKNSEDETWQTYYPSQIHETMQISNEVELMV